MLPPNKLGWMAGIIDLKGTFLRKNNRQRATPQIVLMVESKHIQIIRELGSLTGTSPDLKTPLPLRDFMRKGCSEHCPDPHVHVNEYSKEDDMLPAMARWTITGTGIVVVLYNLMPFLIIEKGYKEIYDEIMKNTPLVGQGSGMVLSSIRRLKLLGWDIPSEYEVAME